jgi:conjugative transfer pilus assembly protein TraH
MRIPQPSLLPPLITPVRVTCLTALRRGGWLLAVWLLLQPLPGAADLAGEMEALLESLTNATEPTAYLGQRRGVLSGGSLAVRNRVMNPNLISVVPPHFRGGCGGIDLFMGSFSFISADEFMQMLRAIAANAPGYFFQLALDAYCPDCMNQMARLSHTMRELTSDLGNSCEMAQRLVNATVPASWHDSANQEAGLIAQGIGAVTDALAGLRPPAGQPSPQQLAQQNDPDTTRRVLKGNVVWRSLKSRQVGGWFAHGDDRLLEAIMSLTGTVIVGDIPDGGTEFAIQEKEPLLDLPDLLLGSGRDGQRPVNVWSCGGDVDPDGCLNPVKRPLVLKGLITQVEDILLGQDGQPGLLERARFNLGPPTESEKAFMDTAPGAIVGGLRNLVLVDYGAATLLAREAVPVIALEMAGALADELEQSVRLAASLQHHALTPAMLKRLDDRRQHLAEQRRQQHQQASRLLQLIGAYRDLRDSLRQLRYRGDQRQMSATAN